MLQWFALSPALHQLAQPRELFFIKLALELKIELEPRKLEYMRDQVFRVQARALDLVLGEICGR